MTEPDVALTDYGLTILCSSFAWALSRFKATSRPLQTLWIIFFASVALASLVGGTVHGFFVDKMSLGRQILWPVTVLAIGCTASIGWVLAGHLISGAQKIKNWQIFAVVDFLIYTAVIFFYSQRFVVVIANYLPAMIALLIASICSFAKSREMHFLSISAGIFISFVAAYVQQSGLAIHPEYFNHNATYHLIQAVGLGFIYRGATKLLGSKKKLF